MTKRTISEVESESTDVTLHAAKRQKRVQERFQRLNDVDAVSTFVSDATLRVVVFCAGWLPERSDAAEAAVDTAMQGHSADVALVRLEADDESGEIAFELGVSTAPCVKLFRSGVALKTVAFGSVDNATLLQEEISSERLPTLPSVASAEQFQELVSGDRYTVFDFYADWCAPCSRIKPHLPGLAASFPDAAFFKVDRDKLMDVHSKCGVEKIPTFQIYKNGEFKAALQHSDVNLVMSPPIFL